MNNFHYVAVLLDMLYGMEIEDEDLEEIGLLAWNHIGNKRVQTHHYCAVIDPVDLSVTLPCNAINDAGNGAEGGTVEAVTASWEDWERVTNKTEHGSFQSAFVENVLEYEKPYRSHFYIPGKLLKYEEVGDKLYFAHNYGKVHILYKGTITDEEGLPEITDKEANAIATYIAYVEKFKEGLKTNNQNITQQAVVLNGMWQKQCDQARTTYLNQNDMNNIIEVAHSWDRAAYNKSYKPIR